ncbi:MAG: DNA recombination protein RmuC [Candidatus Aenigmarchaeota archaeon]|nr:DNA recombination protein RmuC [Candidatus Aenigmarchaeota archaeon]
MIEIILLLVGLIVGFLAGIFYGKSRAYKSADLSTQVSSITGLTTQIAEMKVKFEEVENNRQLLEAEREKTAEEKEKRIKEFMDNVHKLFNEQSEKNKLTDEEKEKRIIDLMEQTKKFFEEQKDNTQKFLLEQGKTREEAEKKRDAQIEDMKKIITTFTKAVSGTKTRGLMGEELLKDVLSNSIKAEVVKYNLKTENGEVEFAWNLEDGKYIPIDSKLPDVFETIGKYNSAEDQEERKGYKKEIIEKTKKEIRRIQKYQNLSNTIGNCLLVVPEGVLEIAPELVGLGKEDNVFVCSYKDVFPIAHVLHDQYIRLKEEGDIGKYKQIVESLFQILDKISKKTKTIETALTQIKNANEDIKDEIIKGQRQEAEGKRRQSSLVGVFSPKSE